MASVLNDRANAELLEWQCSSIDVNGNHIDNDDDNNDDDDVFIHDDIASDSSGSSSSVTSTTILPRSLPWSFVLERCQTKFPICVERRNVNNRSVYSERFQNTVVVNRDDVDENKQGAWRPEETGGRLVSVLHPQTECPAPPHHPNNATIPPLSTTYTTTTTSPASTAKNECKPPRNIGFILPPTNPMCGRTFALLTDKDRRSFQSQKNGTSQLIGYHPTRAGGDIRVKLGQSCNPDLNYCSSNGKQESNPQGNIFRGVSRETRMNNFLHLKGQSDSLRKNIEKIINNNDSHTIDDPGNNNNNNNVDDAGNNNNNKSNNNYNTSKTTNTNIMKHGIVDNNNNNNNDDKSTTLCLENNDHCTAHRDVMKDNDNNNSDQSLQGHESHLDSLPASATRTNNGKKAHRLELSMDDVFDGTGDPTNTSYYDNQHLWPVDGSGNGGDETTRQDVRSFLLLLKRHRQGMLGSGRLRSRLDSILEEKWCDLGFCGHSGVGGGGGGGGGGGSCEGNSGESSDDSTESVSVGSLSLLCAERVNQMTKTYNDIEAVSRLLEEKERDLELAARIGQTLLSKNKELTSKNESLDEQLSLATDKVNQLRHDLSLKEELLRFFNEDLENEAVEKTSPSEPPEDGQINVDFLQKKLETLENENLNLRLESTNLKTATACYEEKEKKLVEDCIKQLAEVNCQVESFAEELQFKAEENEGQKDQITKFLTQTADLQVKIRKLTVDNMDLHEKLTTSTDSQKMLTKELGRMQDKYDELYEMLEEAQVELRVLRGKHKPRGTDRHHQNAYNVPTDSLASELETSLQQELDQSNRRAQSWKIFETARAAKRAVAKITNTTHPLPSTSRSSLRSASISSAAALQRDNDTLSLGYSAYTSDGESMNSDGYTADMDSLYGSNQELGRPGIPGSNDLESALRRLALRRENERELEEEDRRQLLRNRLEVPPIQQASPATSTPRLIPSPGGMSTPSSSVVSLQGYSPSQGAAATLKSSDKLKIMKPLEGSVTLRHWQHLATPHLGGIFEQREGVQMKGERKLETEEEIMYRLSDYEEDDDVSDIGEPSRDASSSSLVHSLIDAAVRSPGSRLSKGWLDPQDPRTPSPALAFYGQSLSSPFNEKPMQASTPVLNSNTTAPTSSTGLSAAQNPPNSLSLGLAALLDSPRDSASLRGSVMRAAVPLSRKSQQNLDQNVLSSSSASTISSSSLSVDSKEKSISSNTLSFDNFSTRTIAPNPESMLFSARHLLSRYKGLPGSRSAEEMSTGSVNNLGVKVTVTTSATSSNVISASSQPTLTSTPSTSVTDTSSSTATADKNSWVFSPGMTGQGFLQQLKNRGYSLYGLWANATAAASPSPNATPHPPSSDSSSRVSTILGKYKVTTNPKQFSSNVDTNNSNSSGGSSNSSSVGFNFVSGNRSTSIDLDAADDLSSTTVTTAITSVASSEPGLSSPSGGSKGVFGMYSNLRQGGLL